MPDYSNYPADEALALIEKYESGGQNIPNYRYDVRHTASGYYQITNTNWKRIAPLLGISVSDYPNAMAAPKSIQAKVATYMYQARGFLDWAPFNDELRAAIARGEKVLTGGGSTGVSPESNKPATSPVRQPGTVSSEMTKFVILAVAIILILLALSRLGVNL